VTEIGGGNPPVRRRVLTTLLTLSFFLLAFLFRLAPLGRYVTPDEPVWVYRSVHFADALAARDWAAIPATGQPGVTTMWLGALGKTVQQLVAPAQSAAHLEWVRQSAWLAPDNGEGLRHLGFFLPAGRVAVALVTSLGLLAAYGLMARRFDRRAAVVAVGLLAFDPFLAGHSGLLHTDGLLASFCLLALLSALNGLQQDGRDWAWWGLSGLFAGLALLTKTPAVVLLAFLVALFVYRALNLLLRHPARCRTFRQLGASALAFLLAVAAIIAALYPALWADLSGVAHTLQSFAGRHMESVQRPIFFAGRTTLDPGAAFYPIVFLFRLSPVVLIELLVGLLRLRRLDANHRGAFLTLFSFVVLFGLVITFPVKKHDRYLLAAFPPLTVAAALLLVDVQWLKPAQSLWSRLWPFLPVALQLLLLLPFSAHPLTAFNPLLGGPAVAERVLPADWGEGMGAAARWLNRLAGAGQLTVAAADVPSFAPLFDGHTVSLDDASLADYLVLPFGGSASIPTEQVATLTLGFRPHTVVLAPTAPQEQARYLAGRAGPGDLILLDADAPLLRQYGGPGAIRCAASQPDGVALAGWLAGEASGREALWLVALPGASPVTRTQLRRQVEAMAAAVSTDTVAGATVTRYTPRPPVETSSPPPYRAAFGGQLALVDGVPSSPIAWPAALRVTLRWRALAPPLADYRAVVGLWDEGEQLWSHAEQLLLDETTRPSSAWQPDHWTDATYDLPLPPGIPPGTYAVAVSLYDEDSGAMLGAVGPDGVFRGTCIPIGHAAVNPPATPPPASALGLEQPLDWRAGPLLLLGAGSPPDQVLSGDPLSLALFWQAADAPRADYRLRLQLVEPDGRIALMETVSISPYPPSRWRAGQRFESRYDLRVPPELPAGAVRLALNVLDGQGLPLWEEDRVVAGMEVLPRRRSFALPEDIPHRLEATFGQWLHLRGVGVNTTGIERGGVLRLTLYWQAEGPADRDYTLFAHLIGPGDQLQGQADALPGGSEDPSTTWAAGQVVVQAVEIPVAADAPAGAYRIAVGLYDAVSGERLLRTDVSPPSDQLTLPLDLTLAGGAP